jgi:hypothetical protein
MAMDGLAVVRVRSDVVQTLADAEENISLCRQLLGGDGRRFPVLVDIRQALPLSPEVRHFYTGDRLMEAFSALGLLVESSPLGRTMGNIYLRIASPRVPTRLFTEEASALVWLRSK